MRDDEAVETRRDNRRSKRGVTGRESFAWGKAHRKILDRLLQPACVNGDEKAFELWKRRVADGHGHRRCLGFEGREGGLEPAGQIFKRGEKFSTRLLERESVIEHGTLRRKGAGNFVDGLFEIRIVLREGEGGLVIAKRLAQRATSMMYFGDATNRCQVLGSGAEYPFELRLRRVELVNLEECPPERDARGKIPGMDGETGSAGVNRIFIQPGAAVLFGELRKRNRRRILLDPASKLFYAGIVRHG